MATIAITKLSTTLEDRTKWKAWVEKAGRTQPDLIFTPEQRQAIKPGSVIVVGHRNEPGSNAWVYCSTGYVILAGSLKNRISLDSQEVQRGWIET